MDFNFLSQNSKQDVQVTYKQFVYMLQSAAQIMRLPVRSSAVKSIMKNTRKLMPDLKSLVY